MNILRSLIAFVLSLSTKTMYNTGSASDPAFSCELKTHMAGVRLCFSFRDPFSHLLQRMSSEVVWEDFCLFFFSSHLTVTVRLLFAIDDSTTAKLCLERLVNYF